MRFHLDTDFLVHALSHTGPERTRLGQIVESEAEVQISAVAWYEFCRGPRTPEQMGVARALFAENGIVPFCEELAVLAADAFRRLGSPRRRAADIAIGTTAVWSGAVLLSRNVRDFEGIEGLLLEGFQGG